MQKKDLSRDKAIYVATLYEEVLSRQGNECCNKRLQCCDILQAEEKFRYLDKDIKAVTQK